MDQQENIIAAPGPEVNESNEIEIVDEELPASGADDSYDVDGEDAHRVEAAEEPEEDVDEIKKKKKKSSLKSEFNKVQRDKYRALHELEEIKKENARLHQLASQSADAATSHYEKSIDLQIEQAKALKTKAYDEADTEALIKADEVLAKAYNQKSLNDSWKSQQVYLKAQQQADYKAAQQQAAQQQYYEEPAVELNEDTQGWLESNTWFDPRSEDFDPEMSQDVQDYSAILERKYIKQGREDSVFTQEYYNEINRFIAENYGDEENVSAKQARANVAKPRMSLNMKQVHQNVAPVSQKGIAPNGGSPNRVVLTARERDFAKQMGVKPEVYAKHKLEIQKSHRYDYENYKR